MFKILNVISIKSYVQIYIVDCGYNHILGHGIDVVLNLGHRVNFSYVAFSFRAYILSF